MSPLLARGWWKRPESIVGVIAVALQTAMTQPDFLRQGTRAFAIVSYLVMFLSALGIGSSLLTASRERHAPSPSQEAELERLREAAAVHGVHLAIVPKRDGTDG